MKDYVTHLDREAELVEQFKEFRPIGPAPLYKCPVHRCEFRSASDKARCPDHGRLAVRA